ncbi:SDR family oxidoreductase [Micromonospora sp. DT43]|uniref:SDR family oxidoreductase n=1 Tax=Micromonospora sp. DT43 TaxID=3393440 RepID=UPI003CF17C5F
MDIHQIFSPKALAGEVAVVTGGGSGLGYAIARDFAACGAEVVITSRSAERLEAAELRIAEETGQLCSSLPTDVRNEDEVARLRDFVTNRHGPAGIVVNNAAANFFSRAERMGPRALNTVLDTDLQGTFNVTRAFVPDMLKEQRGTILNVTLPYPERGFPGFSHAGAAKAAIVSMTASWAYEWGRYGIRVVGLAPGPIPTEGVATNMLATDDPWAPFVQTIPMRRLGQPFDISAAAVFLCSPAAGWITGTNVIVDGGTYLNTSPEVSL